MRLRDTGEAGWWRMAARALTVSDTFSAELGMAAGGGEWGMASSINAGGGGKCSLELLSW